MIDWNDYYYFALIADEGSYSRGAACGCVEIGIKPSNGSAGRAPRREAYSANYAASGPDGGRGTVCCRVSGAGGSGERARAVVMAAGESPQGMLRVSAPVFMAETWFGEFVSEFIARWPRRRCKCWQLIARWIWSLKALILRWLRLPARLRTRRCIIKITYSGRYFSCQFAVAGPPSAGEGH